MTNATTAESIPPQIEKALDELTTQLKTICKDDLVALILYGGLARGSYLDARSDINLMLILRQCDPSTLQKIAAPLTAARRKSNVEPFILEEAEIARVADVFPIKILDIQRSHRVLAGRDVFGSITVDREHIRLSVEQSLRNMQLRLRRVLTTQDRDPLTLQRHLRNITRPLALELRQLLELQGTSLKAEATAEIFQAVAPTLKIDLAVLTQLCHLREGKDCEQGVAALASGLLGLLGTVVHLADTLNSEV